jgi:excinuclease UvrABC helicase subunit UvrB
VTIEERRGGFRSVFERTLDTQLKSSGVAYDYEKAKVPYILSYNYIPDFYIPKTGIYIEAKGYLRSADQIKMRAVKRQHPNLDIRFVFMEATKKVPYTKSTHAQWAERHGFPWAEGRIPEEWLA